MSWLSDISAQRSEWTRRRTEIQELRGDGTSIYQHGNHIVLSKTTNTEYAHLDTIEVTFDILPLGEILVTVVACTYHNSIFLTTLKANQPLRPALQEIKDKVVLDLCAGVDRDNFLIKKEVAPITKWNTLTKRLSKHWQVVHSCLTERSCQWIWPAEAGHTHVPVRHFRLAIENTSRPSIFRMTVWLCDGGTSPTVATRLLRIDGGLPSLDEQVIRTLRGVLPDTVKDIPLMLVSTHPLLPTMQPALPACMSEWKEDGGCAGVYYSWTWCRPNRPELQYTMMLKSEEDHVSKGPLEKRCRLRLSMHDLNAGILHNDRLHPCADIAGVMEQVVAYARAHAPDSVRPAVPAKQEVKKEEKDSYVLLEVLIQVLSGALKKWWRSIEPGKKLAPVWMWSPGLGADALYSLCVGDVNAEAGTARVKLRQSTDGLCLMDVVLPVDQGCIALAKQIESLLFVILPETVDTQKVIATCTSSTGEVIKLDLSSPKPEDYFVVQRAMEAEPAFMDWPLIEKLWAEKKLDGTQNTMEFLASSVIPAVLKRVSPTVKVGRDKGPVGVYAVVEGTWPGIGTDWRVSVDLPSLRPAVFRLTKGSSEVSCHLATHLHTYFSVSHPDACTILAFANQLRDYMEKARKVIEEFYTKPVILPASEKK